MLPDPILWTENSTTGRKGFFFNPVSQPVSDGLPVPESDMIQTVKVKRGASVSVDNYRLSFADFEFLGTDEYPENATIAVSGSINAHQLG